MVGRSLPLQFVFIESPTGKAMVFVLASVAVDLACACTVSYVRCSVRRNYCSSSKVNLSIDFHFHVYEMSGVFLTCTAV